MKTSEFNFITQSQYGRNKWWTYVLFIFGSIAALITTGQIVDKLIIPFIVDNGLKETYGKENITFVMIAFVFGAAIIAFATLHNKVHKRPFTSLINALPSNKFRFNLYLKGIFQWGIVFIPCMLILDWESFKNFIDTFQLSNFTISLVLAIFAFIIQTLGEELIFRGYLLQNITRKFNKKWIPYTITSLLFALAHLGYGIQNFIFSFVFSIVAVFIVVKDNGIERVAGIHLTNNLVLSVFFIELDSVVASEFSWEINYTDGGLELLCFAILLVLTNVVKLPKKRSAAANVVTSGNEVSQ